MKQEPTPLLLSIVTGDVSPSDPEVLDRTRRDPEFAGELAELLETVAHLDAVCAEPRAVLDEVRETEPSARRPRRTLAVALVLAAAIVVTVLLLPRSSTRPDRTSDPVLGTDTIAPTAPVGTVPSFERFAWTSPATTGWFEVTVFDTDGEVLAGGRSGPIEAGREWHPDATLARGWPDRIEWEVSWYDGGAQPREVATCSASRSR